MQHSLFIQALQWNIMGLNSQQVDRLLLHLLNYGSITQHTVTVHL